MKKRSNSQNRSFILVETLIAFVAVSVMIATTLDLSSYKENFKRFHTIQALSTSQAQHTSQQELNILLDSKPTKLSVQKKILQKDQIRLLRYE